MDQNVLDSMQKIVATAFAEKLFTDVEILLAAKNKILFHQAYSSSSKTSQKNSIFDLASLTKPLATSLAVCALKLNQQAKLNGPSAKKTNLHFRSLLQKVYFFYRGLPLVNIFHSIHHRQ